MFSKKQLIIIDLDGTLVDSVPDLAFCVNEMQKQLNLPIRSEKDIRNWVGNGVERLVKRTLINQLNGEPKTELFNQAIEIFIELYAENNSKRSHLYDGVSEGLDWLQSQNYALACVTNKAARFTEPLLKQLGIYDKFGLVISGDSLAEKKPHPLPLLHAGKFFSIEAENSLMLGDSINDVKAARAAKFDVICVDYGYNHGEDINDANPDTVISSFVTLKEILSL
jgi:phosphoglycolate phosphatase